MKYGWLTLVAALAMAATTVNACPLGFVDISPLG